LVVASWVDDQVAQDLAGGGVDDGDVEVLDEQDDVGSGVGSADADVAKAAGDAQGDAAGFVDLVAAGAVVGVGAAVAAGSGLRQGGVEAGGGGVVRKRAVRSSLVVLLEELIEEGLQLRDAGRLAG
jgi:hypothetical protein